MKVLSLLQPWATLVVMGAKKIETRSWNTKYRGPLLIHASAGKNMGMLKDRHNQFLATVYNKYAPKAPAFVDLPFGKIIGSINLVHTFISELTYTGEGIYYQEWGAKFTETEMAFGDYSPGRYGWLLANPKLFTNPIPAKGALGLWEYSIEDHVIQ